MTETEEHRRKRIIYRAVHRGFKEADILIGGFARERLDSLSAAELDEFEALLQLNDHDIYGWVMGTRPVPDEHDTALIAKMTAYAQEERAINP